MQRYFKKKFSKSHLASMKYETGTDSINAKKWDKPLKYPYILS